MKSKEAETYLNRCYKGGRKIKEYNRDMADKAVEIAEEEMKDKAVQSFCKTVCGGSNQDCESCTLIKSFVGFIINE